VLKDMVIAKIKTPDDLEMKLDHVRELATMVDHWQLVQGMPLTFDMLDPQTRYKMKIKRDFGNRNPFLIPNDRERLERAIELVRTKGIENLPPVIMKQTAKGLDLWEGWHRTMAAFREHPEGFRINAWIATGGDDAVTENFADGKKPGRRGLSKRVGVSQKMSIAKLKKIASTATGERRRMAQWNLNMKRGRNKK
jgi:hypothetical protein